MFSLVTPPVRRALVAVAFHDLAAASPECLKCRTDGARDAVRARGGTDALDLGTLVVVGDKARAIVVLNLDEVLVAAHAVQLLWWRKFGKETSEGGKRVWLATWDAREYIGVEGLGRYRGQM